MSVDVGWQLALALVVLVALAVAALTAGRLPLRIAVPTAVARAIGQLAVAAVVITVALRHLALAFVVVAVMYAVAVLTAARRSGAGSRWPWLALAVLAGWVPVLVVIFATGVVPLAPEALIPFGGIILGGTMTAASQAARRAFQALGSGLTTFEAGLALGLSPPDASAELTGRLSAESLYPALDQTRTVGVVTLPGAFIGVLLGGGTPLQAAAAQVLVLVGLLAAESVTVVLTTRLVDRGLLLDAPLRTHQHLWS